MLEVLFRPNLIVKILSVLKSGRYRLSLANGFSTDRFAVPY